MSDAAQAAAPPRPLSPRALPSGWSRTPAARIVAILGLLLLMLIPDFMVSSLIREREGRQQEVLAGFRRGWGPEQVVVGPVLAVPYTWVDTVSRPEGTRLRSWARIPASRLQVTATLQPETRRRGLFQATVYTAAVELGGTLTLPALEIKNAPGAVVDWADARILLGASDLRGLPAEARLDWNGASLPLEAEEGLGGCGALLGAPAGLTAAPAPGTAVPFRTTLTLRGTQAFRVLPLGRQVMMRVASPWPTPSFTGATLPLRYDLGADGFTAQWELAGDARTAGWQQRDRPVPDCAEGGYREGNYFDATVQAGVELQEAVPTYLMVARAAKYGVLFLALSYLTLFLFEVLSRVRAHLVQYGLLGLSVSLFALLLVSVAEPLGFTAGYAVATAAVLAQASLYIWSVVRRGRLAATFAGVLGGLFAFLYVVLSLDAYALLAGTVALFAALSVVMLVTRRVNWAGAPA